MKRFLILLLVITVITGIVLFFPELSQGQTPPPPPTKPTQNPIDGGLAILAAAGGAYAIKKLRDKKS